MFCLPKGIEPKELTRTIRKLSWDVSGILKSYNQIIETSEVFHRKLKILNQNQDQDLVTSADIEISELIKNRIIENYPHANWSFLSEEDMKTNSNIEFKNEWVWIIDPIDGTKDFVNRTGEYAMHLALLYKKELIFAVVPLPSKDKLWIYQKGKGTWCENIYSEITYAREINSKTLKQSTLLTSKTHFHSDFKFLVDKLKPKNIKGMGSVGYKIAAMLRGEGDIYISYSLPNGSCPKDWDIAAPMALIKGAGGYFTDINGNNLEFLNKQSFEQNGILIASLNRNHQEICKEINNIVNN